MCTSFTYLEATIYISINFKLLGASSLSASAHKFRGPKGIGFLLIDKEYTELFNIKPYSSQEFGMRMGTQSVPLIHGMSIALDEIGYETKFDINGIYFKDTKTTVTTIIFEVRSVPAALYKVLGGFATNGINLTKLESYIGGEKMTAARFYVDAEGHPESQQMKNALDEMKFYTMPKSIKILGSYKRNK